MSDASQLPFLTPLTKAQRKAAGLGGEWVYAKADRVRFHELDPLNHVNNVAYFSWFETLRVEYLMQVKATNYGDDDPQVVVASNYARYFKPMYLGQNYVMATRTKSFRNSSFVMEYGVFVKGELMCGGECLVVILEQDGVTKRPLPAKTIELFLSEGAEGPAPAKP